MIKVPDKHNCCGCSACVQICPTHCISFEEDRKGFRYPLVKSDDCIVCGLCIKVCPYLNKNESRKPLKVYAAINPQEEIRMKSSSGGIFTLLAESVIKQGGVVFGARFTKDWEVIHDYTETIDGIGVFRGSKYLQSKISETYQKTREFLKAGRKVLFTGTSCQIMGLKKYLFIEYDNLLTVDIVCHGVPSPLVWREYLKEIIKPNSEVGYNSFIQSQNVQPIITSINFRDKTISWTKFSIAIRGKFYSMNFKQDVSSSVNFQEEVLLHETFDTNLYMKIFLKNLCLRPSCSNCPAKSGKSLSDISIADYWQIDKYHEQFSDNKGTSMILIYSNNGIQTINSLKIDKIESEYNYCLSGNRSIEYSVYESEYAKKFWKHFLKSKFEKLGWINKTLKPTLTYRIINKIKKLILNKS